MSSQQRNAPQSGTLAAIIRVRAPSGRLRCWEAETVEITGPYVSSTGSWRDDSGRLRRAYVWPASQLVEIRYVREVVAA
jgi:hypothetical protein